MTHPAIATVTEEDVLRAQFWGLLAMLLNAPPSQDMLDRLAGIPGDDTPLGLALGTLAEAARATDINAAAEEYDVLFIGLTRGELLPYGSYYMTGFLHEKPLAALRADMAALGIGIEDDVAEPEDHIAMLAEMMQGLIAGALGEPLPLPRQKQFFAAHIQPWADRFFADLESARAARFYRSVGGLGRAFLAVEAEAFAMID